MWCCGGLLAPSVDDEDDVVGSSTPAVADAGWTKISILLLSSVAAAPSSAAPLSTAAAVLPVEPPVAPFGGTHEVE